MSSPGAPCPEGYTGIGLEMCIKGIELTPPNSQEGRLPWTNASKLCEDEGARLVSLDTPDKLERLSAYIHGTGGKERGRQIYIKLIRFEICPEIVALTCNPSASCIFLTFLFISPYPKVSLIFSFYGQVFLCRIFVNPHMMDVSRVLPLTGLFTYSYWVGLRKDAAGWKWTNNAVQTFESTT